MTVWNWKVRAGVAIVSLAVASVIVKAQSGGVGRGTISDSLVAERFRNLDKNRDDRLTKDELGVGLFEQLNVDGDDAVTLAEAQGEIRKRGLDAVVKAATAGAPVPIPTEPPLRQGPKRLVPGDHGVGRLVPDLVLSDINGKRFQLSDFADRPAVVIAFTNTTCPISKKYLPSLAAIERQFAAQKIPFVYVNPTASDKPSRIQAAIAEHRLSGPYVRDSEGALARAVGATHTTDVFVLDSRRTITYRGAVDDQYGFEYSREAPQHEYLKLAIGATIDRRPLLVAATLAPGCPLDLEDAVSSPAVPTFHNRISRIMQLRCLECHREGGPAPFALDSYENVVAQSGAIRQAVERGVMPPWFAARPENGQPSLFANDKSLSDLEKSDLLTWLGNGKPEGDPHDAPQPREFPSGWRIGSPDHIVQLPKPMPVKATGVMPYQDVIVDAGIDKDQWVQAMEIRPTAPEVVHHVLVSLLHPDKPDAAQDAGGDEADGFFVAYAPGHDALVFPEGFGKKLPAGARLKFQMHFTPNGIATQDQTRLAFRFSSQEPARLVHVSGIANPRLSIPPGAANHEVTASHTLRADTTILAFFPHMHLRGKAFRYEAILPDGRLQTLLDVPRYDFNWQLSYRLAEPLQLPRGTSLHLTGWFDNSADNPANPDPTRTVKWGPQTFDEMMLGYIEYYTTGAADGPAVGATLETVFRRLDRDRDGKLAGDELPGNWKERLLRMDADKDQAVTLDEVRQGLRRQRSGE